MKLELILSVIFTAMISQATNLPESCDDLGGIAVGQVSSTDVEDLDQNQVQCTFKVSLHHGNSKIDYNCPIDLYDVEQATFVDSTCTVKAGDEINHSLRQVFSQKDMTSRGLFYWIEMGGFSSEIVFPNYGK